MLPLNCRYTCISCETKKRKKNSDRWSFKDEDSVHILVEYHLLHLAFFNTRIQGCIDTQTGITSGSYSKCNETIDIGEFQRSEIRQSCNNMWGKGVDLIFYLLFANAIHYNLIDKMRNRFSFLWYFQTIDINLCETKTKIKSCKQRTHQQLPI